MGHTAVFLMNLGGPRSLEEVEPYLYELFSDPLVVTAPFGPLRPLFAKIVSKTRAPSSAEKYALIGGKSPIVEGTLAQARALAAALGPGWSCHLAMRCGHPNTEEGVRAALAAGATRAVALPLYPQYANATTMSSLLELRRLWPRERPLARPEPPELEERAHRGRVRVLRVERQRDGPRGAGGERRADALLRVRVAAPHREVTGVAGPGRRLGRARP